MFSMPVKTNNDQAYQVFITKLNLPLMKEQKKESAEKTAADTFTLFDRVELRGYLDTLEICQENYLIQKNFESTKQVYINLINGFPDYPDAYIQLADLYAKNKDHRNAIKYYDLVIEICPFDINLTVLRATECMYLNTLDSDSPYKDIDLTSKLKEAKKQIESEKAKEIDFRAWYQSTLLKILKRHNFTADELQKKIKKVFPDVYMGHKAQHAKKYALASYFSKKVLLKFEEDFLSINQCAMNHHFLDDNEKALMELDKNIKKIKNPQTYLAIFAVHYNLHQFAQAKEAIIACLTMCDKADTLAFKQNQDEILKLIHGIDVIQRSFSLKNLQVTWEKITAKGEAIKKGSSNKKCDAEIEALTTFIKGSPGISTYYLQRAFFYLHKGPPDLAKLDYSIALWLGPVGNAPDAYIGRAVTNLILGKMADAQTDLDNALQLMTEDNNTNRLELALEHITKECIRIGSQHLRNENISLAEKTFIFGILKSPSAELYIHYAKTLELQERYVDALDALKFAHQSLVLDRASLREIDNQAKQLSTKLIPNQKIESKISAVEPVIEPQKKKKPQPPKVFSQQPKKRVSSTSQIKSLLSEEEEMKTPLQVGKPRKKKNKNINIKSRRSKVRETESDDTPIAATSSAVSPTLTDPQPVKTLTLELLDYEKNIFNLLNAHKAEHPNQTFNTYITGGWAFDRIRNELFNTEPPQHCKDIDIVTDIPFETLKKCFPNFLVIPQVKGLLKGTINGIHVDIICREQLDLKNDALTRDFLTLYFDENGVVHDPAETALNTTRLSQLKCTGPVTEIFKRDPLSILRAIYTSSKRNLTIDNDLREQIPIDKHLLVPRHYPDQNDENMPYHPYRFNSTLKKIFSQGHALENYDRLRELGLLEILFPEISADLEKDNDWMRAQIRNTDRCTWPKLEIVYSNMIVCAVMNEALEKLPAGASAEMEWNFIRQASARIMNNSLLFQNRFTSVDTMYQYLNKSISEWKFYRSNKPDQAVTEELPRPRMA